MAFELPQLEYDYSALEPYIDTRTMEIHHSKHHQAYVNNLNNALEKHPNLSDRDLSELVSDLNSIPEDIRTAVRNNGGGHFNHSLFWKVMAPNAGGNPDGKLAVALVDEFGSLESFKELFKRTAMTRFGSGWAWLGLKDGRLTVISTPNQDVSMIEGVNPLLGLDVWEHAYYLKYQNLRGDYINNWWNVVNWEEVSGRFNSITK